MLVYNNNNNFLFVWLWATIVAAVKACPYLRQLQQHGGGWGWDDGGGGGNAYIQDLLDNYDKINRDVTKQADGTIETHTYSSDPVVTRWLQQHVAIMVPRATNGQPVRNWDPFFEELVKRRSEFETVSHNSANGVEVTLSATTACGQAISKCGKGSR